MPVCRPIFGLGLSLLAALLPTATAESKPGQQDADRMIVMTLDVAGGPPTIIARIKGQEVRFALDPIFSDLVVVNPGPAQRLGLSGLPFGGAGVGLDGAIIKGKVARFGLAVGENQRIVSGALFPRLHGPTGAKTEYDVAGGFEALPADVVLVRLNEDVRGPLRDIVFSKPANDNKDGFPVMIEGTPARMVLQFLRPETWVDERAAQLLVDRNLAIPVGGVTTIPVSFDLQMSVQSLAMDRPLDLNGLPLTSILARTRAPMTLREPDDSVILVRGERKKMRSPVVMVGPRDLETCSMIIFERMLRKMTLRCSAVE